MHVILHARNKGTAVCFGLREVDLHDAGVAIPCEGHGVCLGRGWHPDSTVERSAYFKATHISISIMCHLSQISFERWLHEKHISSKRINVQSQSSAIDADTSGVVLMRRTHV